MPEVTFCPLANGNCELSAESRGNCWTVLFTPMGMIFLRNMEQLREHETDEGTTDGEDHSRGTHPGIHDYRSGHAPQT